MSDRSAKTIVLVAGGLMFAAIGLKRDQIQDPFRYAWAAGLITLFLSLLADVSPEVAGPAAVLVLIAVYWRNLGAFAKVVPQAPASSTMGGK